MSVQELARVPHIVSGAGARAKVGNMALNLTRRGAAVLFVADPGLAHVHAEIASSLLEAGLQPSLFKDFTGDPTIAQTDAAAAMARRIGAECVVALGGGSALDLGKTVAAMAGSADSALKYQLCEAPFPAGRLKIITLPTTSGTGAEVTRTAILTRADKAKVWLWGEETKADAVILDPELTVGLPAFITAATGIDALVHAVEAATNRNAHALNNVFAFEAIRLVGEHLLTAIREPTNLQAREGMARAAMLAGLAIDNCGTALAHNIGHALGSLKPVHHGRAVGIAMLASMEWNIARDDGRFAACARALGAGPSGADFARAYEHLLRTSGIRLDLAGEFPDLSAEKLAHQMLREENIAMINSNWRHAGADEALVLAQATLFVK